MMTLRRAAWIAIGTLIIALGPAWEDLHLTSFGKDKEERRMRRKA